MPPPRQWTADDARRLVELHASGVTMAVCCEKMQRSASTIQRRSREAGIVWNGAIKVQGVQTKAVTNAERRQELVERMTKYSAGLLDRLEADTFEDLAKGAYGSESMVKFKVPPTKSVQQLTASVRNLLQTASELERLEQLHNSGSALDDWLKGMVRERIMNTSRTSDAESTGDRNASLGNGELQA